MKRNKAHYLMLLMVIYWVRAQTGLS